MAFRVLGTAQGIFGHDEDTPTPGLLLGLVELGGLIRLRPCGPDYASGVSDSPGFFLRPWPTSHTTPASIAVSSWPALE